MRFSPYDFKDLRKDAKESNCVIEVSKLFLSETPEGIQDLENISVRVYILETLSRFLKG